MRYTKHHAFDRLAIAMIFLGIDCAILSGCRPLVTQSYSSRPVTLTGTVVYDDGKPASNVLLTITNTETGVQSDIISADADGRFRSATPAGDYAIAASSANGFGWIEKQRVPNANIAVHLIRSCHRLTGQAISSPSGTRISLIRKSKFTGDTFVVPAGDTGRFDICLPAAHYLASLAGSALSRVYEIVVPSTNNVILAGFSTKTIHSPPTNAVQIDARVDGVVDDIARDRPAIIGLGEAMHGTAEFVTARSKLTFELIRRLNVQLLLFEFDAIAGAALDDFVNGADIDIAKAVTKLGFWVTNTVEFIEFLQEVKSYNLTATNKVHIWGIDIQNTIFPSEALLDDSAALTIDVEDQSLLRVAAAKRGRAVLGLTPEQRDRLDALLKRLSVPRGPTRHDLLVAVASRSLAAQFTYFGGDVTGELTMHRDQGMASLANFLSSQFPGAPACLWAHDAHVSKELTGTHMGHYISSATTGPASRYYAVGFYLNEGISRAWDFAGKLVGPHVVPPAPGYSLEHVFMRASNNPDIAWVPIHGLVAPLANWLRIPRVVRELGAGYTSEADMMVLRDLREAFDAVVVIKRGHASTPAPVADNAAAPGS